MKKCLFNLFYKILVYLVDHDSKEIKEENIDMWLVNSYKDKGFMDWLTNKYSHYTKYLAGSYRGDDEYKKVMWKLTTLRQLENEAKTAYSSSEDLKTNIN